MFQSRYQRDELVGQFRRFGFQERQGRIIRGAMDADEFPFQPRPHAPGEAFVVGRISRADPDKFSPSLWKTYGRIPHPVRARVLGWKRKFEARLGPPPPGPSVSPPDRSRPRIFCGRCTRWFKPARRWRTGPASGWRPWPPASPWSSMPRGAGRKCCGTARPAISAATEDEQADCAARLAYDEDHRLDMARRARRVLTTELAEPRAIWSQWRELFEGLS